jgi:hypothetical protein
MEVRMFAVELRILNEDSFADAMTGMREWLDHRRFEPSVFRYTFSSPGMLLHVDFSVQDEAVKFAESFGGQVVSMAAAPVPARQFVDSQAEE